MGHGVKKLAPEKIRMAMAAHGKKRHYKWKNILPRHWVHTGEAAGMDTAVVKDLLVDIIDKTPRAINSVSSELPKDFPPDLAESIFQGLKAAAKILSTVD